MLLFFYAALLLLMLLFVLSVVCSVVEQLSLLRLALSLHSCDQDLPTLPLYAIML